MTQHEEFMRRAISLSELASLKEKSGGVFGAVVVKDNKIVGEGYNQVMKTCDPTWHAEMQAIREASQKLATPHLEGCILYTSAEPCPMCLTACYWAHIEHIYYAATVEDAKKYGKFEDIDFYEEISKESSQRRIQCTPLLREEAKVIWKKFSEMPNRLHY